MSPEPRTPVGRPVGRGLASEPELLPGPPPGGPPPRQGTPKPGACRQGGLRKEGSLSRNQTAESGLVSYRVEPPSSGALSVLGRLGEGTSFQSYLCSTCLRVPVRAGRGGGGGRRGPGAAALREGGLSGWFLQRVWQARRRQGAGLGLQRGEGIGPGCGRVSQEEEVAEPEEGVARRGLIFPREADQDVRMEAQVPEARGCGLERAGRGYGSDRWWPSSAQTAVGIWSLSCGEGTLRQWAVTLLRRELTPLPSPFWDGPWLPCAPDSKWGAAPRRAGRQEPGGHRVGLWPWEARGLSAAAEPAAGGVRGGRGGFLGDGGGAEGSGAGAAGGGASPRGEPPPSTVRASAAVVPPWEAAAESSSRSRSAPLPRTSSKPSSPILLIRLSTGGPRDPHAPAPGVARRPPGPPPPPTPPPPPQLGTPPPEPPPRRGFGLSPGGVRGAGIQAGDPARAQPAARPIPISISADPPHLHPQARYPHLHSLLLAIIISSAVVPHHHRQNPTFSPCYPALTLTLTTSPRLRPHPFLHPLPVMSPLASLRVHPIDPSSSVRPSPTHLSSPHSVPHLHPIFACLPLYPRSAPATPPRPHLFLQQAPLPLPSNPFPSPSLAAAPASPLSCHPRQGLPRPLRQAPSPPIASPSCPPPFACRRPRRRGPPALCAAAPTAPAPPARCARSQELGSRSRPPRAGSCAAAWGPRSLAGSDWRPGARSLSRRQRRSPWAAGPLASLRGGPRRAQRCRSRDPSVSVPVRDGGSAAAAEGHLGDAVTWPEWWRGLGPAERWPVRVREARWERGRRGYGFCCRVRSGEDGG